MSPQTRDELGWYAGAIYFGSWGSGVALLAAPALAPRLAAGIRDLAHLSPTALGLTCLALGHVAIWLAPRRT